MNLISCIKLYTHAYNYIMPNEEFLTVNQAAEILKVHSLTVRRYIKEGKLKAVKAAGIVRVPASALQSFGTAHSTSTKDKAYPKMVGKPFTLEDPIFKIKGKGVPFSHEF
jgi:excisionase family DNA binding protein